MPYTYAPFPRFAMSGHEQMWREKQEMAVGVKTKRRKAVGAT
jgi:hypothetical protein